MPRAATYLPCDAKSLLAAAISSLRYAVDANERKVGGWAIPLESPMRFWLPPDPGCEGRSLMHAGAEKKRYVERFVFRAPPAGTGPITFRVLVKQGETNRGAFYWTGELLPRAATALSLPAF